MVYIGKISAVDTTQTKPRIYYTWDLTVEKVSKLLKSGVNVTLYAPPFEGSETVKAVEEQTALVFIASDVMNKVSFYWTGTDNSSTPALKTISDNADGKLEIYIQGSFVS